MDDTWRCQLVGQTTTMPCKNSDLLNKSGFPSNPSKLWLHYLEQYKYFPLLQVKGLVNHLGVSLLCVYSSNKQIP